MTRYNLRKWKTRHWQASFALLGPLLAAGMVLWQLNRSATIEAARNNYSVEKDVVKSFIDVLKAQSARKAGVVGSDVESELLAFDSTIYIAKDLEGHDVLRKGDLENVLSPICERFGEVNFLVDGTPLPNTAIACGKPAPSQKKEKQ
jgi:hypothetical protein